MHLMDRLNEDLKSALKAKDKKRLAVIRGIKSSLQNEAIKEARELEEEETLLVLNREWKQRKESLHEFEKANRDDLTHEVEQEIKILSEYMPKQLSEEDLDNIVQDTIQEVGASSKSDIGVVMSAVMPKVQGKADGKQVNQLVQKHLT
ncbi:GatB/YqeY domain-containing protein [Salibacterium salarium]|uniref:GatB/YqeY domain-containing protein n=1 Tax=Salibacterium salarium TaxID=284579 RepID=A0A428MZT2_9BACI|nr:GatB/YqeY domain-containing protein [Salibacterium salarium]RSL31606.1 GatB/YqeY domain-containing protein [Salibacterium salarium]